MSTSTPPAWHWLEEQYVPVKTPELSTLSRKLAESDMERERNDSSPGPAGTDVWPLERAVSTTASSACRADRCANGEQNPPSALIPSDINAAPEHVENCVSEGSRGHPAWVCSDCGQDRYGELRGVATWHMDRCDICGETQAVTEARDFSGYHFTALETTSPADSCVVESCPECGTVTDIEYGPEFGVFPKRDTRPVEETLSVPLWKQALWLARNIEDLHSPRPDVVSDDELRGMTLIRVLGIGADEHGDEVFRKTHEELAMDRSEEWSDGEFYDLVDRFGMELRCTLAGAT